MFKGVIFDFDGVVVDSHQIHLLAWGRFLDSLGKTASETQLQVVLDGRRRDDILRHFLGELCEEEISEYGHRKDQFFRSEAAYVRTIDGFIDFLNDLQSSRLPFGIASSGSRNRVDFLLQKLGLKERFRVVVTGDDVTKGKPDPALYLKAAQGLEIDPLELIAFEDAVSGVKAAKAAGMKCIGIAHIDRVSILQEAGANHVVSDFRCLSMAILQEIWADCAASNHYNISR